MQHEQWASQKPVTIGTFYDLKKGSNFDDGITKLKYRALEVFQANPWLAWRLIKHQDGEVRLEKHKEKVNFLDLIYEMENDKIFEKNPLFSCSKICEEIRPFIPLAAGEIWSKTESLSGQHFRLLIIHNSTKTQLCVCLSIQHAIADAHTMYSLWKMFDHSEKIFALDNDRIDNIYDKVLEETGFSESLIMKLPSKTSLILKYMLPTILWNGIKSIFFNAPTTKFFSINEREISNAKQSKPEDVKFVSTNDILVSWYFKMLNCKYVFEAVNLRTGFPKEDLWQLG